MRTTIFAAMLSVLGCGAPDLPVVDGGEDAVPMCTPDIVRPSLCEDMARVARCNADGLLNAAMCFGAPGKDPLPSLGGYYPSYGCIAPAELNSGSGDDWVFWCCSKVTPGPIETGCGTCYNEHCLY